MQDLVTELLNASTLTSLGFITGVLAAAWGLSAAALGRHAHDPTWVGILGKKILCTWLLFDALVHGILELAFVVLSIQATVQKSDGFLANIWKEYGKADARWLHSDPTVVSVEILTAFLTLPLLLTCYGIVKSKRWAYFLLAVICVAELYGGFMTWLPELLQPTGSLNTGNPLHLWVYMVLFNGIWVVVPGILLWDSYVNLVLVSANKAPKKVT